eukprot:GDKH01016128.1.p1 GENE.GDKH01016128.1~~GDKH01016128.1.p1  ORF type:complete len:220 (-),score=14.50 GDKH01016128.1:218-877(-)
MDGENDTLIVGTSLKEKQRGVFLRIIVALPLTVAAIATSSLAISPSSLGVDTETLESRLALLGSCELFIGFALMAAIGRVANFRFFSPNDIDGSGLTSGTDMAKVLQSINQNTLEQVFEQFCDTILLLACHIFVQAVLAFVAHTAWVLVMPPSTILAVPVSLILFVLGRVLFAAGYNGGAPKRAIGFAFTFYPSAVLLLTIAVYNIVRIALKVATVAQR